MRIVFLGKPGSGKGTQAALLAARLGLPHLSSGAILREEMEKQTPFGVEVGRYVLRGEIGPQELITTVVLGGLERRRGGDAYILDGFPRTLYQARELDARFPPVIALLLSISDEALLTRLSGRLTCDTCGAVYHESNAPPQRGGLCDRCAGKLVPRADDTDDAIGKRLEIFRSEVEPVIAFYRDSGRLHEMDGTAPPDEIHARIVQLAT